MDSANIDKVVDMLIIDEGLKSKAYDDANGKEIKFETQGNATIGIGTNIADGLDIEESMALCAVKLKKIYRYLSNRLPYFATLSFFRQSVLLNVAYNVGEYGLFKFNDMLTAIQKADWNEATKELLDSAAARKLRSRYERLAYMLLNDKIHPAYLSKK